MTRTTISVLAALMLGGASVALAGGANKSTSDQTQSPARSEASSSGSGTTSGMSAGESSKSGVTTGTSSGASGAAAGSTSQMSASDIEEKLEKQGYTQVSDVKKVGDKFEAKAVKNGETVNLEIDPATGMVKDKTG